MVNNPLQQFFRQPKIFISLPSLGVYNNPGIIQGDVSSLPIYGMTGMDEILMKTPDALMTGDSTVKVIESCCPAIKDGWDVSTLDVNLILIAIRIATYGDSLSVTHTCTHCQSENNYDIKLTSLIDHYNTFKYDNRLVLKDLSISIRPLNYKQSTAFSLKNFELQQKVSQIQTIKDTLERNALVAALFQELSVLQKELFKESIESIHIGTMEVTQQEYINDWLNNCDQSYYESIKKHINLTKDSIQIPPFTVTCGECSNENHITIDLDQANFFGKA